MEIILVGTGNVARVLGRKLNAAGHQIVQVYGRNIQQAQGLALMVGADATDQPGALSPGAAMVLIAVSDAAIPELAKSLHFPHSLVVHTAGSVPAAVLGSVSNRFGVFYPLQSLRPEFPDDGKIPFLLQAHLEEDLKILTDLAHSLGSNCQSATDESRLQMHLAAVWVNNFPNILFSIAYAWCKENQLDYNLLKPLMEETVSRLKGEDPFRWQTGPAIRKDQQTMDLHTALLKAHPNWQELYQKISMVIQSFNHSSG